MTWMIRYLRTELPLVASELTIGRTPDCSITVDDVLVSRRHARFVLRAGQVAIEDLGSHNGVMVNGQRIAAPTPLRHGDRIVIGSIEFELIQRREQPASAMTVTAGGLGSMVHAAPALASPEEPTFMARRPEALEVLGAVVERALAAGHADEAARLLASYIGNFIADARRGAKLPPDTCAAAARCAVHVAKATHQGVWIDHAVTLYRACGHALPAAVSEEARAALPGLDRVDVKLLREYAAAARAGQLGAVDRATLGKLEDLERAAVLAYAGRG